MEDLTKTRVFSSEDMRREMIRSNLKTVINALNERGYNAVHQIAGYLISNDPAYISSHKNARNIIQQVERDEIIEELVKRYPVLESVKGQIEDAYKILETCYEDGGKLLIAGNGGSAADSDHIVGELMKGFVKRRPVSAELAEALKQTDPERGEELAKKLQGGLPAIALTNHAALSSAFANDVDGMLSYAQQLNGYGIAGDVFLGISTSGNSENVMYAAVTAKAKGLKVVGLTGKTGGKLAKLADVAIIVPEQETYKIQELHLPIYHALCLMLEDKFYAE